VIYSIQPTELVLHIFLVTQILSLFVDKLSIRWIAVSVIASVIIFTNEWIDVYLFEKIIDVYKFEGIINPQIIKVYMMVAILPFNVLIYFIRRKRVSSIIVFAFSSFAMISVFIIHYGYIGVGLNHTLEEAKSDAAFLLLNKDYGRKGCEEISRYQCFTYKEPENVVEFIHGENDFLEAVKRDSSLLVRMVEEDEKDKPDINKFFISKLFTSFKSNYFVYTRKYRNGIMFCLSEA